MIVNPVPALVEICLEAAAAGEYWRVQRRILERLPEQYANPLLVRLLHRKAVRSPDLELFRECVTSVTLNAPSAMSVAGNWVAYLADYRHLRQLQLLRLPKLKDAQLQPLGLLGLCLQHLSLEGCPQLTARLGSTLAQLTSLQSLSLSETGIKSPFTQHLTGLAQLKRLCLGGLDISDQDCAALAGLTGLEELSLWGSQVTEAGAQQLHTLPALADLDLSWTAISAPPLVPSLRALQLRSCTLSARWAAEADLQLPGCSQLRRLDLNDSRIQVAGADAVHDLISASAGSLAWLNLSGSQFSQLAALRRCAVLSYLDLTGAQLGAGEQLLLLSGLGVLTSVSLQGTSLGKAAVAVVATVLPGLQSLDLSHTRIDDEALTWIAHLTSLTQLNLSGTAISGSFEPAAEPWHTLPISTELLAQLGWDEPGKGPSRTETRQTAETDLRRISREAQLRQEQLWGDWQLKEGTLWIPTAAPGAAHLSWAHNTRLQSLQLLDTQCGAAGAQLLARSAPSSLRSLQLGSPHVNDRAAAWVAQLTMLTSLMLQGCRMTDVGASELEDHPCLEELSLSDCWLVSDKGMRELCGSLPALRVASFNGAAFPVDSHSPGSSMPTRRNARRQQAQHSTAPLPALLRAMETHDQRWRYTAEAMTALRASPLVGGKGDGSGTVAALLSDLPPELQNEPTSA